MNTIIALLGPRIVDLLKKINDENNELLNSDNYADLIQRIQSIEQINKELADFSATYSNNTSNDISIGICNDNIFIRSKRFGNFDIIYKKDYMKDNLEDNYEIEGQSSFIDTFLKYFSNVMYLSISFFSLEKRYKVLQKSLNVSLKKEIDFIKESLLKTQDYEKIIDNILNGVSYVKFNIKKNNINTKLCIEMKNTYRNIPNFDKGCIYLPKIKNGTISDYFKTYKEFSSLIILDEEEKKLKFVNILESFKLLKQDTLITNSHDVNIKKTTSIVNFREEYLTVLNYIKENYRQNRPLGKNFFYLTFNYQTKVIFLNNTKKPAFSNLSISFDLGAAEYILPTDSSLISLFKPKNPASNDYYCEIDKEKIIGIQRTKENIKYF